MTTFWSINVKDPQTGKMEDYSLVLDFHGNWAINKNGVRILKYSDSQKKWWGLTRDDRVVTIQWPIFREIVETFLALELLPDAKGTILKQEIIRGNGE